MGTSSGYICRTCGTHFTTGIGGGFFFDKLRCETCGTAQNIRHQDLGDIHLRYVKGLPGPYAVRRMKFDYWVQAEYPGEPLTEDEYHAAAEATLGPCGCGGRFRYDAPARCPDCRSTPEQWDVDPKVGRSFYD
jgi:hypothetical protein